LKVQSLVPAWAWFGAREQQKMTPRRYEDARSVMALGLERVPSLS
jgi:hypothetical protein